MILLYPLFLIFLPLTLSVKQHDFKTCSQSSFCRRFRSLSSRQASTESFTSPYSIKSSSFQNGKFSASVKNDFFPSIDYELSVEFSVDGVARVGMDQVGGLKQRYNEAGKWSLVGGQPLLSKEDSAFSTTTSDSKTTISYGSSRSLVISYNPIQLEFKKGGVTQVIINERGLLNMEHYRPKKENEEVLEELHDGVAGAREKFPGWWSDEDKEGMWGEDFGGKRDSKLRGEAL
jgi:mannosyl-oligosaccharide alpha-1,3-glucosidase